MVLASDNVLYAGVASVDITPDIGETFTDLNDNTYFDGCLGDPDATKEGCDEPFDDLNGNGHFDPVWIGGFGPLRPALGVHDPIYARAVVLSFNEQYLVLVALDLVGLGTPRIHEARDSLVVDGFDGNRLMVASSHNHGGPDSMGLWGDPESFETGLDYDYQERLANSIEQVVRSAATGMVAVELQVGAVSLREQDPKWFNGANFGGSNPSPTMHGLIYDGRDPIVVSDTLLVLQGVGANGTAFTLTNWSGHPETRGDENNMITSDYVATLREELEARYGGMAMHLPESLGGMQSALGGNVPLIENGAPSYQTCGAEHIADADDEECFGKTEGADRLDADGDPVPAWAPKETWAFASSLGWHLAEASADALAGGERHTAVPLRVEVEDFVLPIENEAYSLLAPFELFDLGLEDALFDEDNCPEYIAGDITIGCLRTRTFRAQIGPVGFTSVPGELLPELGHGFPEEDPRWLAEVDDPTARGPEATYFIQHDADCNDLDYADCTVASTIGECECLQVHAWPYRLSDEPSVKPLLAAWDGDTSVHFTAIVGMTDNYLSYIIPEPDFNRKVSLISGDDGDHYEDTVSPAHNFATRLQQAQARIAERW